MKEIIGYPSNFFFRSLPSNVRTEDIAYFQNIIAYRCPDLKTYKLESTNLLPDGTLFRYLSPLDFSFLFFKKRIVLHNWKGILYIRLNWSRIKLIPGHTYVVIHDPWTKNYYHWITQALPRLLLIQQLNQSFHLLLPEDHDSEFHIESLKLLHVKSWGIIKREKKYYLVNNLLYPTHDIQVGDYNDDVIKLLRDKLSIAPATTPLKKVFAHRTSKKARRLLNEAQVLETFASFGFEIIEFELLPFTKQILLMSTVKIFAGVHGAGLSNMIFMPVNSSVFELTTTLDGENYYYFTLSNTLAHKYYYQICDTDKKTVVQEANLMVDIEKLKENITLLIRE